MAWHVIQHDRGSGSNGRPTWRVHEGDLLQQPVVALRALKLGQEAAAKLPGIKGRRKGHAGRSNRSNKQLVQAKGRHARAAGHHGMQRVGPGRVGGSRKRRQAGRQAGSTWASPVNGLSGWTTRVLPGVRRSSGPCITTTNLRQQQRQRLGRSSAVVSASRMV
jgi:hypothetical protein